MKLNKLLKNRRMILAVVGAVVVVGAGWFFTRYGFDISQFFAAEELCFPSYQTVSLDPSGRTKTLQFQASSGLAGTPRVRTPQGTPVPTRTPPAPVFTWTAPGASPSSGTGQTFSAYFTREGTYGVMVSVNRRRALCRVRVAGLTSPSPSIPPPSPSYSATPTATPSAFITIKNTTEPSRWPVMNVGDRRLLTARGPAGATIDTCNTHNGQTTGCSRGYYSFDSTGLWTTEQSMFGPGYRTEWIEVNGVKSNIVAYTVKGPPSLTIMAANDTLRTTMFWAGDTIRYSSIHFPGDVKLCITPPSGSTTCDVLAGEATGSPGLWIYTRPITSADALGTYRAWVENDGYPSPALTYSITSRP